MQDYGQTGGAANQPQYGAPMPPPGGAAPPPPAPPKKKKGGKLLLIIGIVLLIVGILMMVMLWPMVGTIDNDEAGKKIAKGDKGTYTVVDEINDDDYDAIKEMKDNKEAMEFLGLSDDFYDAVDGPGTYTYKLEVKGEGDAGYSKMQKVPTAGGILGIVLLIVGVILLIFGIMKMMKAKKAAAPGGPAPGPAPQQPMYPPQQPPQQQPPQYGAPPPQY